MGSTARAKRVTRGPLRQTLLGQSRCDVSSAEPRDRLAQHRAYCPGSRIFARRIKLQLAVRDTKSSCPGRVREGRLRPNARKPGPRGNKHGPKGLFGHRGRGATARQRALQQSQSPAASGRAHQLGLGAGIVLLALANLVALVEKLDLLHVVECLRQRAFRLLQLELEIGSRWLEILPGAPWPPWRKWDRRNGWGLECRRGPARF